jgi:hypothetical protein
VAEVPLEAVLEGDGVWEGLALGLGLAVSDTVELGFWLLLGVGDGVALPVGGTGLGVALRVWVAEGLVEGDSDGEGLDVLLEPAVAVKLAVVVSDKVGVALLPAVGLELALPVGLGLAVGLLGRLKLR